MKKMYVMIVAFMVCFMLGGVFAANESPLSGTLSSIADQIKTLVPVVALLMLVMGGLIYGIGQVMGAEVRGRAAVWAQALIIGAIIGLMISALAIPLIKIFSNTPIITNP